MENSEKRAKRGKFAEALSLDKIFYRGGKRGQKGRTFAVATFSGRFSRSYCPQDHNYIIFCYKKIPSTFSDFVDVKSSSYFVLTCRMCALEFLSSGPTQGSMRTDSLNPPFKRPSRTSIEKAGGFQLGVMTGHPPRSSRTLRSGRSPVFRIRPMKKKECLRVLSPVLAMGSPYLMSSLRRADGLYWHLAPLQNTLL